MSNQNPNRRSYGAGSLDIRADQAGVETWYGRWYHNGRRVKRRIGPRSTPGARTGLTRPQAEAQLRRLIGETHVRAAVSERLTVADVGERYVDHARRSGRKPATWQNIESELRVHLIPFFAGRSIGQVEHEDVVDLVGVLEGKGLAPKSIRNVIATLSACFNFAKSPRRRWATFNPCDGIELPAVARATEIRYLALDEVDAIVERAPAGMFHAHDRALYLTAAMTGLRLGELVALRWRDVDWLAQRIRVRQNYVRGQFGTPKSKRSTRSVPMAIEVAAELERLFQASRWQADGDLVFAHPATGGPIAKSNILRRLRKALDAAGLDRTHRFHDLRHTFGTHMAAAGVPLRTLQEWMGHRDLQTTQIYADYAPSAREADMVAGAFARGGPVQGPILSESDSTLEHVKAHKHGGFESA